MKFCMSILFTGVVGGFGLSVWIGCQPAAEKKKPETLILQLQAESPEKRRRAAEDLGQMGPAAAAAVPALIAALADTMDPKVSQAAAYALGDIGPAAKEAVPALRALITEERSYVTIAAAGALGQIDKTEKSQALDFLLSALTDQRVGFRANAVSALGHFNQDAKRIVPSLATALRDTAEDVRRNALTALRVLELLDSAEARAVLKNAGQ